MRPEIDDVVQYLARRIVAETGVSEEVAIYCVRCIFFQDLPALLESIVSQNVLDKQSVDTCVLLLRVINGIVEAK